MFVFIVFYLVGLAFWLGYSWEFLNVFATDLLHNKIYNE